jgi:hypothetical protein
MKSELKGDVILRCWRSVHVITFFWDTLKNTVCKNNVQEYIEK